jgi:hypothetical protein
MNSKNNKTYLPGLQPVVDVDGDMVVNRSARRPIQGIAFNAQKSHLVRDEPDSAGNERYRCKIADVSDGGFGVVCRTAATNPELFQAGEQMTLQGADGKRVRVQIRWIKNGRLGLRILGPALR